MLCLRRQARLTQKEELARLRWKPGQGEEKRGWLAAPFEAMKKRVDPYSLIYVRGFPDGVVGRYMEELEYDDGNYDFGAVSRGSDLAARRRTHEMEYFDWGDSG